MFSTVVNFGVLGILQRLNHLQISECDLTKIKYPQVEAHRKKDGHCTANDFGYIQSVTKEEILICVLQALAMAKQTSEGMAKLQQSSNNWDYPPIPGSGLDVRQDDVDEIEDIEEFKLSARRELGGNCRRCNEGHCLAQ